MIADLLTYVGELTTFTIDEIQLDEIQLERIGLYHLSNEMILTKLPWHRSIIPISRQWCNEFRYRSLSSQEQRGPCHCPNDFRILGGCLVGRTTGHAVQRAFRPTGEPCLESHTRRSGVTVHGAFPPFPTKKKPSSNLILGKNESSHFV